MACVFVHRWKDCFCKNCGAARHKWGENCTCSRCGRQHDWRWDGTSCYEKCSMCQAQRIDRVQHHKWNATQNRYLEGCKCTVCGATNSDTSYRTEHNYKGIEGSCDSLCSICGNVYKEGSHDWDHCKCRKCNKIRDDYGMHENVHDWNHCVCRVCGKMRDNAKDHDWNHCVCRVCGKMRDNATDHDWVAQGCIEVCSVCDKKRTNYDRDVHDWEKLDGCKEKCKKCGLIRKNHSFEVTTSSYTTIEYDNGWPNNITQTFTTRTCTVCGYKCTT